MLPRVLQWPTTGLWPAHICFPTSQISLLCWEVSEHTQHACEMVADTLGAYVFFLCVLWDSLMCENLWLYPISVTWLYQKMSIRNQQKLVWIHNIWSATWLFRHRTEWHHPLGCSKTLLLFPDLPVKLSVDGSGQSLRKELSLITGRCAGSAI